MSAHEFSQYDAAYVLGTLSPGERRSFEAHLADCPECAQSVRELAGMPGLLGTVTLDDLEADPGPVPDTLLPRLTAAVRRRRRRQVAVAAACSAVVLAGAVTLGALAGPGEDGTGTASHAPVVTSPGASASPGAGRAVRMTPVGRTALSADLAVDPVPWGTRLTVRCTYAAHHPYSGMELPAYALVVRDGAGTTQQVATWRAVAGREMTVTAATSWAPSDVASVEVRTLGGEPALRLRR